MIKTVEKKDILPVCPHCKTDMAEVWFRQLEGDIGKRCAYFCPKCRSCLGISHRKGFMMGL